MDAADEATEYQETQLERAISAARGDIPPGMEGDCDLCGEWSGRLLKGVCAPCRDKHHLD